MEGRRQLYKYLFFDALTSLVAWALLNGIRMMEFTNASFRYEFLIPEYNARIVYPLIPIFWLSLYWLSGYYNDVCFKSRLSELISTLLTTVVGSIILFFGIIIDDPVSDYSVYLSSLLALMGLQFTLTYTARITITSITNKRIINGELGFNTLILGVGGRAAKLYADLQAMPKSTGFIIRGFVNMSPSASVAVPEKMMVGKRTDIKRLIDELNIQEVIIATENTTESEIYSIMGIVGNTGVKIKFIPSKYQLITGCVRLDTIYGVPMIDMSAVKMSAFEINFKRLTDIFVSILALIILSPLYCVLALCIGRHPIHSQERVGLHGKPFKMYKFRSMIYGAENGTPMLTAESDPRVTKIGKWMRKYRLDELPQFYNVLRGDMSIVGPRPERQFYIDQIVKTAPYYYMLQNVKPGITSWGMVKFGYANTVEQMVERASYDIIYIENASMLVDIKIAIYTLKTIITGEGM